MPSTSHTQKWPSFCWSRLRRAGGKQQLAASRGRKLQEKRSRSHPEQPVLITTAGNARPGRLSPGPLKSTLWDRSVTSSGSQPRASSRGPPPGTLRGSEPGPALSPRCPAPTVSQQPAGGCAGWLGASRPPGSHGAPGGPERPAPPARPPSHTVSQQHHSRLARPLSAASDPHRRRRDGGAAGRAREPLPMEWRMSMEASRSVLSRDWALWNSTTAAAAILPLSHRPRPRPPTPETHTRKARPRVPPPGDSASLPRAPREL